MLKEIDNEEAEVKFNSQQQVLASAFNNLAQKSTQAQDYYDAETDSIRRQDDMTHWDGDEEQDYDGNIVYRSYPQKRNQPVSEDSKDGMSARQRLDADAQDKADESERNLKSFEKQQKHTIK